MVRSVLLLELVQKINVVLNLRISIRWAAYRKHEVSPNSDLRSTGGF